VMLKGEAETTSAAARRKIEDRVVANFITANWCQAISKGRGRLSAEVLLLGLMPFILRRLSYMFLSPKW
jgi:hypothetical protein